MASDFPLFDPFKALADIRSKRALSAAPELSQKLSQPAAKEKDEEQQSVDPTFATFATFAGSPDARCLAPARVREKERKNYSIKSYTYARNEHAQAVASERKLTGPAKVAKAAKIQLSHCEQTKSTKTGVAKVFEGDLRKWHSALAAMSPERIPCPGYRPDEWARTLARALDFLDTFGPQALALGWTAPRLFGVHPTAGIVRVDACGALALPGGSAVRAITATEVSFGHLTYREKPGQPRGVPVWEFGR